jgi:hypothetical protein
VEGPLLAAMRVVAAERGGTLRESRRLDEIRETLQPEA